MKTVQKTASILLSLFFLVACGKSSIKEENKAVETKLSLSDQQMKFNGITLSTLEEKEFAPLVYAYGKVEVPPQNKTLITAKFGGFVKKIHVLDGMHIKKGTTLIEIEDPSILEMQQSYLENQSSMEYLKSEFERQELLSQQDATSKKAFQQAKANYLNAKARQTGLRSKLNLAGVNVANINEDNIQTTVVLKAPFDGIITKVHLETGAYIHPQDQLMELIDTQHTHAELAVYEKDIHLLAENQKLSIQFNTKEEIVTGKIYLIGHDLSPEKTIKVHGHFDKESADIIPGAFFKATVQTASKKFLALPAHAVINNKGKNIIFMKEKKEKGQHFFKAIEVTIIAQNVDFIAVSFENIELLKNKKFVVEGAYELFSKMVDE
ncbi:MAG: efflux RND transporter periplasmic adaptor subunit [Flavobacteriia bacterium]|nr:efflux RND transporter periplasmic adaptor subunit [Flavobacteriia bacterium]